MVPVERGGTEVFRRHGGFDLEAAMAAALAAAVDALRAAGMPEPKVIINVSWMEGDREFVAGGAVPEGMPRFIAESLRLTAEEVEEKAARGDRGVVDGG